MKPVSGLALFKWQLARNNMPDQSVSDSQYFRGLAWKARIKADQTTDETYERVADRFEQHIPGAPSDPPAVW
jgi:hypothetical protein